MSAALPPHHRAFSATRWCSANTRLGALPEGDFGTSLTNSSKRIFLQGDARSATKLSSSPADAGERSTTNASGTSPTNSNGLKLF